LLDSIKHLAEKGLRTLAICIQEDCGELSSYNGPQHPAHQLLVDMNNYKDLERNPIILGIVALQDPPRKEVRDSISKCRDVRNCL
jgi:Ca2+-transporting ATPase